MQCLSISYPSIPQQLVSCKNEFPKRMETQSFYKIHQHMYVCIIGAGLGTQSRFVHKGNCNPVRALPTIHHHNNVQARVASKYTNCINQSSEENQWLKPQMGAVELVFWKVEQPVIELTTLNSTTARKKKNSCLSQPPSKPATESSFVVPAVVAPMEFFAFQARTSTPN